MIVRYRRSAIIDKLVKRLLNKYSGAPMFRHDDPTLEAQETLQWLNTQSNDRLSSLAKIHMFENDAVTAISVHVLPDSASNFQEVEVHQIKSAERSKAVTIYPGQAVTPRKEPKCPSVRTSSTILS